MRLTFKSPFPFKVTIAPPQEPPCWSCCAISSTTTSAPTKWERLFVDLGEERHACPPSRLSKKWKEYHGTKNWEGLLDPLDDGLRGEIIRYGSFVEAHPIFDFDLLSTYAACRYIKARMLEVLVSMNVAWKTRHSHRPTRHCHLSRMARESTSHSSPCSADVSHEQKDDPMVEAGVLSLYTSGSDTCPSLQQLLQEEVLRLLRMYRAVGNRSFRHHLEQQGTKILRIVNSDDLITKVPGIFVEDHEDVTQKQNVRVAHLTVNVLYSFNLVLRAGARRMLKKAFH
ncbi:phospholipase A(1) DAD1, chloroplastic-like protein [Tanacetum coccineum]